MPIEYTNAFSNDVQIQEDGKCYLNKKYQGDSVSLNTNAWIRLCAAWVCSGVPDIIITVSDAPGLGSVMVIFASEIWNGIGYFIIQGFDQAIDQWLWS